MTRTRLRTSLIERAAQVALSHACITCARLTETEGKVPGHGTCWSYVEIAREIRKLGTEVKR